MRAGPAGEERCTPRFMVPVSPQCPQVIGVPTLLHLVFQGIAISSEHTSQFILTGNIAELGCSPPLRVTPETSFRRLVPLAGGSWGLFWGQSITNIGSSPWNCHCKRCRPPLAAEFLRPPLARAPLGQSMSGRPQVSLLTKFQHVECNRPPLSSRELLC